jgi:hypothetical protein
LLCAAYKEEREELIGIMIVGVNSASGINALLHYAAAYCDRNTILKILQLGGDLMAEDSKHRLPIEAVIANRNSK